MDAVNSRIDLTNENLYMITYQYLHTHDIHQITILKPSREATGELFKVLSNIFTHYAEQTQLRVILIQGKQSSPLRHFFSSAKNFLRQHPNRPVTKTVVLHQRGQFMRLLDSFIQLLRMPDKIRYIEISQRDEAIEWLTQTD